MTAVVTDDAFSRLLGQGRGGTQTPDGVLAPYQPLLNFEPRALGAYRGLVLEKPSLELVQQMRALLSADPQRRFNQGIPDENDLTGRLLWAAGVCFTREIEQQLAPVKHEIWRLGGYPTVPDEDNASGYDNPMGLVANDENIFRDHERAAWFAHLPDLTQKNDDPAYGLRIMRHRALLAYQESLIDLCAECADESTHGRTIARMVGEDGVKRLTRRVTIGNKAALEDFDKRAFTGQQWKTIVTAGTLWVNKCDLGSEQPPVVDTKACQQAIEATISTQARL